MHIEFLTLKPNLPNTGISRNHHVFRGFCIRPHIFSFLFQQSDTKTPTQSGRWKSTASCELACCATLTRVGHACVWFLLFPGTGSHSCLSQKPLQAFGWSSRSSGWEQSCLTAGILFYSWDLLRYSGFFQETIGNPTDIFQNQGPVRGPMHSTCPNPGTQNSLLRIAQLCIPTEALWPHCSIVPVVVVAKTSQEEIIPASQGKASMEMCLTSVSLHLPLCI